MKDTVTLKELAAIAVRRGRLAVILVLVFAVLLGGVQAAKQVKAAKSDENSPEKIEERYQEAMVDYLENKADLEKQLARAESQLESQREYNEKSLLMEIDSRNKAVTTVNLAITDIDEGAFQQVFRLEDTPVDFIISKIQSQYLILWNSLDLPASLSYTPRGGMEDKYLRETVTLKKADGGCLTLTVSGTSEEVTRQLADAAYECLLELQNVISEGSYLHGFTLLSSVTKIVVDDNLESTQTANLEKITTYTESIENLTKKLEDLKEPKRDSAPSLSKIILSALKYAVLGAAIGLVLDFTVVMASYIFRSRAETSRQLEQELSVPFLGSSARPKNFWNRLADRIIDERIWPDADQALAYLSSSADILLPSGRILLLSTLPLEEEPLRPVIKALEGTERTVRLVGGAGRSPETVGALRDCGCVVLAERAGVTRWADVTELAALARSLNKPVSGFITV